MKREPDDQPRLPIDLPDAERRRRGGRKRRRRPPKGQPQPELLAQPVMQTCGFCGRRQTVLEQAGVCERCGGLMVRYADDEEILEEADLPAPGPPATRSRWERAALLDDFHANHRKVAWAPPDEFVSDHCFARDDGGLWHMFSTGGAERLTHSVSEDLLDWRLEGHVLSVGQPGSFDADAIRAPQVVQQAGRWWMFYAGDSQAAQSAVGLAVSDDLYDWRKHDGPPVMDGSDPCVLYDPPNARWIVYATGARGIAAAVTEDFAHWQQAGVVFADADRSAPAQDHRESPCVVFDAVRRRYMLLLNLGWSASGDPLNFEGLRPYDSDVDPVPDEWLSDQPYYHPQLGFAGETLRVGGRAYRSAAHGPRNAWRLTFFSLGYTDDGEVVIS